MKKTLSILLALAMLLSIIPMTALPTAAADDELAATGEYIAYNGKELLEKLKMDNPDGVDVMVIDVKANINHWVTRQGIYDADSYLRYACTIGQGKKILNLNGYKLHFHNDYVAVAAHPILSTEENGNYEIYQWNRQCLFDIPAGADLTVNGGTMVDGTAGLIQYHGKLLNKMNAVDQRDIFEIRGGNLTVNSGEYYAGGEVEGHSWTEDGFTYKNWMLVGGAAIRVFAGSLTVNGGYFEGRGFTGYNVSNPTFRNAALYVDNNMGSVVINDGHFKGASMARAALLNTKTYVNAAIFEVDQNTAMVGTIYHELYCSSDKPALQGFYLFNPNEYTAYYACYRSGNAYDIVPYENIKDSPSYFYLSQHALVIIEPKRGYRKYNVDTTASTEPTQELGFYYNGKKYSTSDDISWSKNGSLKLSIDPETLYYADQNAADYGVQQSLTGKVEIREYISDGNQPLVQSDVAVTFTKDSKGRYTCDLNSLSSSVKSKLKAGSTYYFKFKVTEGWKNRCEFSIWHEGRFYVDISTRVNYFNFEITDPVYGYKPSTTVTENSWEYNVGTFVWNEKLAGDTYFHEMDTSKTFKNDATYRASFIIDMEDGYACGSEPTVYVNGKAATVTYSNESGLVGYIDYELKKTTVYSIPIQSVPAPVAGETPINYCTYPAGYFTIDPLNISWYDENGFSMKKTDEFEGGKKYTVKFLVNAEDNCKFADNVSATVNGYAAKVSEKWVDAFGNSRARVEYTFTCPIPVNTVFSVDVTIPEPAAGDALSYNAAAHAGFGYEVEDYDYEDQWLDGVCWQDDQGNAINPASGATFEAGRTYSVIISLVLTDEDAFAFDRDSFTASINGQPVDNFLWYSETNPVIYRSFTVGTGAYMIGDADTDEKITILDATAIQRVLASLPVAAFNEKAADSDEDGKLTILDATAIQRHLASLPTNPRIGQYV